MARLPALIVGVLCFYFSAVGSASGAVRYTLTDIGSLPGSTASQAFGINDNGQVVGNSSIAGGFTRGFLYDHGTMTDLGALADDLSSSAYDINNSRQIVGISLSQNYRTRAFLYTNSAMSDLNAIPGCLESRAQRINEKGQIAGYAETTDGSVHAFLYSGGTMTDLNALLPGIRLGSANGINDRGDVAIVARMSDGISNHAFLYSNGTMTDLYTTANQFSSANDINNSGEIVGQDASRNAILYSHGTTTRLGSLPGRPICDTKDINNSGQVVGICYNTDGAAPRAFLYSNGTMTDLNTLIDSPSGSSGWTLNRALAINDAGWIVANGTNATSGTHAFLLTPVPEPSTAALTISGLSVILFVAWRQRRK